MPPAIVMNALLMILIVCLIVAAIPSLVFYVKLGAAHLKLRRLRREAIKLHEEHLRLMATNAVLRAQLEAIRRETTIREALGEMDEC